MTLRVALHSRSAGAAAEVLDKRCDRFLEVVVSLDTDKVNRHALEQFLGRFALAFCFTGECFAEGGVTGVDEECFAGFGVFEFHETCGREFHFAWVHNRHGENIVALAQHAERVFKTFVQKVAHHDDDCLAVQNFAGVFERHLRVGAVMLRFKIKNFADEAQYVLATFFGRNEKFDLVGVNEEADLVVVLDGGKCE